MIILVYAIFIFWKYDPVHSRALLAVAGEPQPEAEPTPTLTPTTTLLLTQQLHLPSLPTPYSLLPTPYPYSYP